MGKISEPKAQQERRSLFFGEVGPEKQQIARFCKCLLFNKTIWWFFEDPRKNTIRHIF